MAAAPYGVRSRVTRQTSRPVAARSVARVSVPAPAKLTLSLRVTGVRPDGMHLLEAEMVTIDLADTLTFEPGTGLSVTDEVVGHLGVEHVPVGPDNLVARALALEGRNAMVSLVKRIPVGAGLGGGSADAAAVLRWSGVTDPTLAAQLGSDVPFCLVGGRARVTGTGEVVEPLPFLDLKFVLVVPPVAVDTAAVYRAWDRRRAEGASDAAVPAPYGNDLEEAAIDTVPALAEWRDHLEGISGQRPRLAGSGSTWYVEGEPESVGLAGHDGLVLDGERAAVISVRTVTPGQVE